MAIRRFALVSLMWAVPLSAQQFEEIESRAAANMAELVSTYSDSLGLPLSFEVAGFRLVGPLDEDALVREATRVARAAALPSIGETGFTLSGVTDADATDPQVEAFATGLLEYGLVRPGFYIADIVWRFPNGHTIGTLGTVDSTGTPRFEPILYFSAFSSESRNTERGSWIERGTRRIRNGFGITCVEVVWSATIAANGGRIVDPAPHVNVDRAVKNCPLWDLAVTPGELIWCRPGGDGFPDCRTSRNEAGEHCLDWVVAIYVVTGFSEIEVDATVGGSFRGIQTNARVRFTSAPFGSQATFGEKGRLCAIQGPS